MNTITILELIFFPAHRLMEVGESHTGEHPHAAAFVRILETLPTFNSTFKERFAAAFILYREEPSSVVTEKRNQELEAG
jgi:hypothetical protein